MAFDPVQPFVLLDDARTGRARLLSGLSASVLAATAAEVGPALTAVRAMGGERAGYLAFEAGYALLGQTAFPARDQPLAWFGRFDRIETIDDAAVDALLDAGPAWLGPVEPGIAPADYAAMLARIAALIAAGDVYQVNATFAASLATRGHPLALYRRLRRAQAASHGALVNTGRDWILSLSPELLFTLAGDALTTRPMKGTAARGATVAADDAAAAALAVDPKNRAENLMIVDLLRNDLSRVAVPGSVAVPDLFTIERYPTVLQMTSTVTATARAGVDAVDVLMALFPCGSVTGAPKHRACQIIAAVEAAPRGIYTGSIGHIGADGDAGFNVAIRTLLMDHCGEARLGLGGGIVADSEAGAEWAEALGKAAFLGRLPHPADLIETMRSDGSAIAFRTRHIGRLTASAAFLGHRIEPREIDAALDRALAGSASPARIRLLVAHSGAVAVTCASLPPVPATPVAVALTALPVEADDWRLRHKTSDRGFYDVARRTSGAFEVIFVRPDGRITEGSFTNVFVRRADGVLLTPPLADGLLPGILREVLIAEGRAVEAPLTAADLRDGFLIGNSLRGLMEARLA